MKKSLYVAVFLGILIVPSITMAAWYNPVSWFKKAPVSVVVPVEQPKAATVINTPVKLPEPKPVFSNNITVENPKLQAQINTLIQSNTDLQIQLASLTTKYNVLVANSNDLSKENALLKLQVNQANTTSNSTEQIQSKLDEIAQNTKPIVSAPLPPSKKKLLLWVEWQSGYTPEVTAWVYNDAGLSTDSYDVYITNPNGSCGNKANCDENGRERLNVTNFSSDPKWKFRYNAYSGLVGKTGDTYTFEVPELGLTKSIILPEPGIIIHQ